MFGSHFKTWFAILLRLDECLNFLMVYLDISYCLSLSCVGISLFSHHLLWLCVCDCSCLDRSLPWLQLSQFLCIPYLLKVDHRQLRMMLFFIRLIHWQLVLFSLIHNLELLSWWRAFVYCCIFVLLLIVCKRWHFDLWLRDVKRAQHGVNWIDVIFKFHVLKLISVDRRVRILQCWLVLG